VVWESKQNMNIKQVGSEFTPDFFYIKKVVKMVMKIKEMKKIKTEKIDVYANMILGTLWGILAGLLELMNYKLSIMFLFIAILYYALGTFLMQKVKE